MEDTKLDIIMGFASIAAAAAIGAYGLMISRFTNKKQYEDNMEKLKELIDGHNELCMAFDNLRGE